MMTIGISQSGLKPVPTPSSVASGVAVLVGLNSRVGVGVLGKVGLGVGVGVIGVGVKRDGSPGGFALPFEGADCWVGRSLRLSRNRLRYFRGRRK